MRDRGTWHSDTPFNARANLPFYAPLVAAPRQKNPCRITPLGLCYRSVLPGGDTCVCVGASNSLIKKTMSTGTAIAPDLKAAVPDRPFAGGRRIGAYGCSWTHPGKYRRRGEAGQDPLFPSARCRDGRDRLQHRRHCSHDGLVRHRLREQRGPVLKSPCTLVLSALLCTGSLAAGTGAKDAATPATTAREAVAESSGMPQAPARLVSEFTGFAGSDANARSLVAGLRQGTEIELTAPGAGGQSGTATRLVPPTRPMDYVNVRTALVLAREQLAQLGITQPTPGQIKAVLAGGGIASRTNGRAASPYLHPGLLQMRAGGMSWAKIAGIMGITLAQAKDGRAARQAGATAAPDSGRPAAARGGEGIVSPAVAGSAVSPLRRASATPAPISSASITKSSAGGPRTAPVAKPAATAQRTASAGREPGVSTSRANVVAAADAAPRVEKAAIPAQDAAQGGAVRITAAAPAASDEPTGSEESHAVE